MWQIKVVYLFLFVCITNCFVLCSVFILDTQLDFGVHIFCLRTPLVPWDMAAITTYHHHWLKNLGIIKVSSTSVVPADRLEQLLIPHSWVSADSNTNLIPSFPRSSVTRLLIIHFLETQLSSRCLLWNCNAHIPVISVDSIITCMHFLETYYHCIPNSNHYPIIKGDLLCFSLFSITYIHSVIKAGVLIFNTAKVLKNNA